MKKLTFPLIVCASLITSSCADSNETMSANQSDTSGVKSDSLTLSVPMQEENSPAGWVLAETFASDDNEYTFCPNGTVLFDNHYGMQMDGNWSMSGDTIVLEYTRRITQVGIGEPLPPPPAMPGNYMPEYEEYEELIEKMHEVQYLFWSELKQFLAEDSIYPYQIIQRNYSCD